MRTIAALLFLALASMGLAQSRPADEEGVTVRIGTIAAFQGIAPNQLIGFGLVTGLAGTGDTKKFLQTQKATVNLLRAAGLDVDPTQSESKNIALVTLTAELPPFSTPGGRIDVTASTVGDCTSLRGGTLLFAPLRFPGQEGVFATVAGPVAVGGFSAGAGGASKSEGFTTVGKLPSGGLIQKTWETQVTFGDRKDKMYLGLSNGDATTAMRIEAAIRKAYPELRARALDPGSIELTVPAGTNPNTVQANVTALTVVDETEAKVVIDEKTGTVVIGGNVRIAPCTFAKGTLTVRVGVEPFVSQPAPLSNGKTVSKNVKTVDAGQETAQIAYLRANTTVADLAAIFQALRLKADDVMNILTALHNQGALKARLEVR